MINDPKKILELVRQGKLVEASFLYDGSFAKFERDTSYLKFGVQLFFELGRRERCLDLIDRISRLSPIEPEAALFVMKSYEQLNATAELVSTADLFAQIFPQNIHIQSECARILQTMGDFEKSSKIFEKILKQFGDDAQIYRMHMISVHGGDLKSSFIKGMEKLWRKTSLSVTDRINLGFALGKVFDDRGDYQKAGHFFKIANDAQANQYPYDFDKRISEAKMFLEAQKGAHKLQASSAAEFTPVFITGMPRSGTTVIETKLLQSGGFETVGEASIAFSAAYRFFKNKETLLSADQNSIERLSGFAKYYCSQVKMRLQEISPFILDKSMRNFMIIGYLLASLPQAKFVLVRRDPADIAQSLYRNFFQLGSHRYSNNVVHIANEIALHEAVTKQFIDWIEDDLFEVRYENFVQDPKHELCKIRDFIGDRSEAVSDSRNLQRSAIQTLSLHQARQPVHSGRISAWEKYSDVLMGFDDHLKTSRQNVQSVFKSI